MHTTLKTSPQLCNKVPIGTPKIHPITAPSLRRSPPLSNTPVPWPIPLNIPNGIQIHSAVLPQYTFQTDRQTDPHTDGLGDRSVTWVLDLEQNLVEIDVIFSVLYVNAAIKLSREKVKRYRYFGHFQSLEQYANGNDWLARCNFLLVF